MADKPRPSRFQRRDGGYPPLAYDALEHRSSRLVQAHEYFAGRAREWLAVDADNIQARAAAIERAVRELMQMVVIDLTADENAQEIFETLNARGAQLTAGDLIKNFIFQRLTESGVRRRGSVRAVLEGVRVRVLGDGNQRGPRAPPAVIDVPEPVADREDR